CAARTMNSSSAGGGSSRPSSRYSAAISRSSASSSRSRSFISITRFMFAEPGAQFAHRIAQPALGGLEADGQQPGDLVQAQAPFLLAQEDLALLGRQGLEQLAEAAQFLAGLAAPRRIFVLAAGRLLLQALEDPAPVPAMGVHQQVWSGHEPPGGEIRVRPVSGSSN